MCIEHLLVNRYKNDETEKKEDSYFWMEEVVQLLLRVMLEYKVNKCQQIIDRESFQSKCDGTFEAFCEQYPGVAN